MALKFFWRCEGTTLDGTHDYSAGDTTATLGSAAAINADAARIGTNGLDCPTSADNASFSVSGGDIISSSVGSAALSFRVVSFVGGGQTLFRARGTSSDDTINLVLTGTDDATGRELRMQYRSTGGSAENRTITTTAADLAEGTWYAAVIRWDEPNNLIKLEVYNSSGGLITEVSGTDTISDLTDLISLAWGETGAASGSDLHIDNCFVADTYAEPLEDYLDITSYTEYGGGGPSVTITDADDETFYNGEVITITCTGAGATQGIVYISPTDDVEDAGIEQQSVVSWSDTSIQCQMVLGDLTPGNTLYLFVVTSTAESNATGYQVSFTAPVAVSTLNRSFGVRGSMRTLVTM